MSDTDTPALRRIEAAVLRVEGKLDRLLGALDDEDLLPEADSLPSGPLESGEPK